MKTETLVLRLFLLTLIGSTFFLFHPVSKLLPSPFIFNSHSDYIACKEEDEEGFENKKEEEFSEKTLKHEFLMLRNPVSGTIPDNIHEIELNAASQIPSRGNNFNPFLTGIQALGGNSGTTTQNTYQSVGPNNVAGRSRALGIDKRNANIMITGGTTGGIFRSTDGGSSWNFVESENDIRSVNSIVQDPSSPDTWYIGTGEVYYTTSTQDIAGTVGYGMFKSTDNGLTWTKLTSTEDGFQHQFNGQFDLVHRLAVHPTTHAIFAAVHNRIERSTDGGLSWTTVLGGLVANSALAGLTEILIPPNGSKIFAAITGENLDRTQTGVWESTNGDLGSWTRIAGGVSGAADSIPGWQPYGKWGRIVLAVNASNTQLFVLYKNGKSASGTIPMPEADLFRADISSGNPASYVWTNLSSWVPDEPAYTEAGIDPYTTQFNGYNMSINVKPDNNNILFIGGTVLHRVDLTQSDPALKFRRIGGYGKGFIPGVFFYPNSHPDIHGIYFPPGNNDKIITVDDGGVHGTVSSTLADTVSWQTLVNNLQTLQFQFVNIYPDVDTKWIIGGAQDNGTQVNLNPVTSLSHQPLGSGDGAQCAISRFTKNGNTWKQYMYLTISQGTLFRSNFTWQFDPASNILNYISNPFDEIEPSGLGNTGQWITLIVNDPDSTEHLYYNNKNRLFRTTSASTVTPSTWTEMTGVKTTIPSTTNLSYMAISKRKNGIKYLYFGTDNGKVYRLNNANSADPAAIPIDITPSSILAGSYVAGVAINPRSPDTVMIVVSNYDSPTTTVPNIFWTGNATSATPTWQIIDGALEPLSSQSCAIVVRNSGVEYYVGTSVGLYSTTTINGNSTNWLKEGSGLIKTAIIRSLVNRQQDNTLVVGTHGAGAFIASIGDAVTITDIVTGIPGIVNDKNFITAVRPTVTPNKVNYTIGNLFTIKKIMVQIIGINGQQVLKKETNYESGSVDLSFYAKGNYILFITSEDGKYKSITKLIKQ